MIEAFIGKPFVLKLDGKVREVGEIYIAEIDTGRTELELTVRLTDEEVAGLLGAASDKPPKRTFEPEG